MSARLNRGNPAGPSAGGDPGLMAGNTGHITRSRERTPPVDQELINHLKTVFKASLSAEHTIRDYDRMLGAQQVIDHLQSVHDLQQDKN